MWVSSISLPNLSLIGLLTTEIYYRSGNAGQTDTNTHTESDTLPISDIGFKARNKVQGRVSYVRVSFRVRCQ